MRTTLLVLSLWGGLGGAQDITWLKLDQAKAVGANTGKLILVYVACDPRSGSAPCNGGAAERSFADPAILKRADEFHFVRVCEKKTAQSVQATKGGEAIFMDAEGDELYRSAFIDGGSLDRAMTAALQKFSPHAVPWLGEIPAAPGGKPLLIVGFDDEKGESLKALEDKTLVKYHERFDFVRFTLKKDAELAKKWGVTQAPVVFICDGAKEAPDKNTLEKLAGKKPAAAFKAALQRALAKIDPKK